MKIFLFLVLTFSNALVVAVDRYSIKDLKALAEQGAWNELPMHLEDIRPAYRSPEWNQVLEQTAAGLLDQAGLADDVYGAFSNSENLVMRFPKLKSNKVFMAKRADTGIKAFAHCFDNSYGADDQCLQDLTKFVKSDVNNLDLAFKAGKLASQLCWKELKDSLTEQIVSNGDYFRQNTCSVFKIYNAVEGEIANDCRKYH